MGPYELAVNALRKHRDTCQDEYNGEEHAPDLQLNRERDLKVLRQHKATACKNKLVFNVNTKVKCELKPYYITFSDGKWSKSPCMGAYRPNGYGRLALGVKTIAEMLQLAKAFYYSQYGHRTLP